MSVPGIEALEGVGGFTPYVAPTVPASSVTAGTGSAAAASGPVPRPGPTTQA